MANDTLIKNLENQLERLVDELADADAYKNEMVDEEYEELKLDLLEQIKEFTTRLTRMTQGDVSVDSKISSLKAKLRQAISESFNTVEMIRTFGEQNSSEYAGQLDDLEDNFRSEKIARSEYETKKVELLIKLNECGYSLSATDKNFLEQKADSAIMENMQRVDDNE